MSEIIRDCWMASARKGRPAPSDRPAWPPFNGADGGDRTFRDGQAIPAKEVLPGRCEPHDSQIDRLHENGRGWGLLNTDGAALPPASPAVDI